MAVDKAIDSTQLDADLTSVANAIRTKGGTSAQLPFPAGFVSAIDAIPTGGGGTQTISFLDWTQQGCNNGGAFQASNTRIACKHGLYKCRSISIPSGVEVAFGGALFPYIGAKIDASSEFVGFWSGSSYTSSFTWFNSQTIDLTQFADWSDNYFVMFLRHPNNSNISPSEGNNVVVTYDLSDGAVIINEMG